MGELKTVDATSLREAFRVVREEVAACPPWLRGIYARNDVLERHARDRMSEGFGCE